MLAAYKLPAEVFYSLCTVWHTQTVCPQLSPAHKRKNTEYNYSVIHWLMFYIVSITHILLSIRRKQLHKVTEVNKALGMYRIELKYQITTQLLNSELKTCIFGA